MSAIAALLPDGRLHLQHGPIDLVIEALATPDPSPPGEGGLARQREPGVVSGQGYPTPVGFADSAVPSRGGISVAYRAAAARFATILDELCAELPLLRRHADPDRPALRGVVAGRMWAAVAPFAAETFVTPMAAVAGSVAEEVLAAMVASADLARASVNNGGDIALHLAPGERTRIGMIDRPDRCDRRGTPALFGTTTIASADPVRGIATSGWRGRSFSRGIADAVTVLARTAAEADAAATIIANAVDLPRHPAIRRVPACEVQCDSDLGERLVTREVGPLAPGEIAEAMGLGLAKAHELAARGLIVAAVLHLQGQSSTTSWPGLARPSTRPGPNAASGLRRRRGPGTWMAGPSPAMTGMVIR